MVKRLTILWAALLAAGCHKGYDLDLRRMGADAGYFVECYCVPDELFCLTATRIAPIDQDQYLDYSLEFETWITAGEEFRLLHSLYHDGSYIYNYASSRRFDPAAADSVRLRMTAPDGTLIAASTAIPPQAELDDVRIEAGRLTAAYRPEANEAEGRSPERCFILSVTGWGDGGRVLSDDRLFREYTESGPVSQHYDIPSEARLGAPLDSVAVELKRLTREGYLYQLSVKEAPDDDRNVHYLGREYFFYRRWDDCIRTLKRHLSMPSATWKDERAASMRYIAKCYIHKGQKNVAEGWFYRAIAEAPHLREPWLDLAMMLYEDKRWEGVVYFTGRALEIRERPRTYMTDAEAWGSLPYDLRAIGLYETGRIAEALEAAKEAYNLEPSNNRLLENVLALQRLLV